MMIKNFLTGSVSRLATSATIIVIFTHNVLFEREVSCTCRNQSRGCGIYITLPVFTIMFLLLWLNKVFIGSCRMCSCFTLFPLKCDCKCRGKCVRVVVLQTVKVFLTALLWVVSVLLDGDWFACCQNGLSGQDVLIPCKTNRTLDEQILIDKLKNKSKVIGLGTLLSILFLAVCFSAVRWRKCCDSKSSAEQRDGKCWKCCSDDCRTCCEDCLCSCDGFAPYELIVVKEGENIVNQILKEKAKEALTQNVEEILNRNNKNRFIEGFDAAEELIKELWPQEKQPSGSGKDNKAEIHKDVWKFTFAEAQQISLQLVSKPEKKDGGSSLDEAGGVQGAECPPSPSHGGSSGQTENANGHRHGYDPPQIQEGGENVPMGNVSSSGGNQNNPPPSDPVDPPSQDQESRS
ncbi:uncharacterized protein LOC116723051 [Xiphophorus hellerii]|uniref:uncharacterized protein LOC116723051 n=1 Tax=Xiphophorus hellerii TaxID=8084 RepID=UPI0013B413B8|nr:uncharacterized protein LOC116723051 [Xiphophorus hellerii]